MNLPDYVETGWRIGVGIVLLNKNKKIFVGERKDNKGAWQMPQGGVNIGSREHLIDAAKRELNEETGVLSIKLLMESKHWYHYYLPSYLSSKLWKGKFIGQKQKWFIFRFTGVDSEININSFKNPEFSNWNWVTRAEAKKRVVDFKKNIYLKVLDEFEEFFEI